MYRDDLIRRQAADLKLSRKALALRAGLHLQTVNAIWHGTANPEVKTLAAIAVALDLELHTLFTPRPALRQAA